jgi:hypothetical protein
MKKEIVILIITCIIVAAITSFITIILMNRLEKVNLINAGDKKIKSEIDSQFIDTNGDVANNDITNLFASRKDTYTKEEVEELISKVNICCNQKN